MTKIRIGTRGSALALKQAAMVEEALSVCPELETEIVVMKTRGDKILDKPLLAFGGKGAFVTEFEEAIRDGRIDLAVHSAKDMPMELAEDLCIGAVLERAEVADVLLLSETGFQKHEKGARLLVGTGSLRRQCQLQERYPHMRFESIRGNVPTRMKKVKEGSCDGIVLAYAGLQRLGLLEEEGFHYEKLPVQQMLPAAGQGIIAIECRKGSVCEELLQKISDQKTMVQLEAERQVIACLGAGCNDAVGAYAEVKEHQITLHAFQYVDGKFLRASGSADVNDHQSLAKALVRDLNAQKKVYLIGAGPGDPGLITVKGLELLKQCDAVVYDHLASDAFLRYVKPECEQIYVGKQAGKHSKTQEEINEILVECGKKHACVVRLKGGDPFVFGRGGEEIEALQEQNLAFEVVPGVTSAVAVAECAGIPVTHRGVARSFHVITGHTKTSTDCPEYDYENIASMEGTLVFLMGLSSLKGIADSLIRAGKDAGTPTAVISNGTMPHQQVVRGSLGQIAEKVKAAKLPSPAVIVIGASAAYSYINQAEPRPMVGLVATESLDKKLKEGLAHMQWEGVSICNMHVCRTDAVRQLSLELQQLEQYTWVLFTSQNAVRIFFEQVKEEQLDHRKFANLKFAVLGSGTAACLQSYGFTADFIPSRYTVECLCSELIPRLSSKDHILLPRAVQGSRLLTDQLSEYRISYRELQIYDVCGSLGEGLPMLDHLQYLVFVSGSGVNALFDELQACGKALPKQLKIACIGTVTAETVEKRWKSPEIISKQCDVRGLLDAMKQYELSRKIEEIGVS